MTIKRLLFVFVILVTFYPMIVQANNNKSISNEASTLKRKLFEAGKPYDLSYTLQAIVLVESGSFEKPIKVNIQDPSAGITHIHIKYFLKRHNIKDTPYNRNRAIQILIDNDDLAIAEAIANLEFWKDRFCNRWGCTKKQFEKVLSSYNCGYNNQTNKCKNYAKKIRYYIDKLKRGEL